MPYAQPLKPGDPERLGEYEIVGRLGEGGQGAVYLGMHSATGSDPYAVKLLHGSVGEERAAFLREVELAKQVARFCTAQVVGAGLEGDRPYIVSEYVDGPSLHREVAVGGPGRAGRWNGWPSARPPRSRRSTGPGSSTATSNRRTSCSAPTAPE
nr:hypothetical protein GCM10020093_101450 [Planobispora longispora]